MLLGYAEQVGVWFGDPASVKSLLIPELVELSGEDAAMVAGNLEELAVYGFDVEPLRS